MTHTKTYKLIFFLMYGRLTGVSVMKASQSCSEQICLMCISKPTHMRRAPTLFPQFIGIYMSQLST